jgi:glucose/arabinose dehydrogenase
MEFTPDGRLFVGEQSGTVWVIKNGQRLDTPFVRLTVDAFNERGLIGLAFDPNFETNRFVYVHYTATTPVVHNRVSRFVANGDVAVSGSEQVILDLPDLGSRTIHNGGTIQFGPDGKLYVAVGDNDLRDVAQRLDNLLGKILRLNPDGSIPSDNPFFDTADGVNRAIWAIGLRNPFRLDIERRTGRMFINDVGSFGWEEINPGAPGANYGWPRSEGPTTNPEFVSPTFAYPHPSSSNTNEAKTGCSITGGAFYDPPFAQFPSRFVGRYFFADFCNNWVRVLDPATGTVEGFARFLQSPSELEVAPDGTLYLLSYGYRSNPERAGSVIRFRSTHWNGT